MGGLLHPDVRQILDAATAGDTCSDDSGVLQALLRTMTNSTGHQSAWHQTVLCISADEAMLSKSDCEGCSTGPAGPGTRYHQVFSAQIAPARQPFCWMLKHRAELPSSYTMSSYTELVHAHLPTIQNPAWNATQCLNRHCAGWWKMETMQEISAAIHSIQQQEQQALQGPGPSQAQ